MLIDMQTNLNLFSTIFFVGIQGATLSSCLMAVGIVVQQSNSCNMIQNKVVFSQNIGMSLV